MTYYPVTLTSNKNGKHTFTTASGFLSFSKDRTGELVVEAQAQDQNQIALTEKTSAAVKNIFNAFLEEQERARKEGAVMALLQGGVVSVILTTCGAMVTNDKTTEIALYATAVAVLIMSYVAGRYIPIKNSNQQQILDCLNYIDLSKYPKTPNSENPSSTASNSSQEIDPDEKHFPNSDIMLSITTEELDEF